MVVGFSKNVGEFFDDEEDDIDFVVLDDMFFKVNSVVVIEKEVVVDIIGEFFVVIKFVFMFYVEEIVKVFIDLFDYYYEGIRKFVVGVLFQYIKIMYEFLEVFEWQFGVKIVSRYCIFCVFC